MACLLAFLLICVPAGRGQEKQEEMERLFHAQSCKYRLPDETWTWLELPNPNILCAARSRDGIVFTLAYVPVQGKAQIDETFVQGFEQGFFKDGRVKKRGGRDTTLAGQRAYQCEGGVAATGQTTVNRVALAHGGSYNLGLVGGADPVENDPRFQAILAGFSFMEVRPVLPPIAAPEPERVGYDISYWLGIAATVLVGFAVLLFFLRRTSR